MKILITNNRYTPLVDDIYKVRFLRIEETKTVYGPVWKPWFRVVEGKYRDCELADLISKGPYGINSKFSRLVSALSGQRQKPGSIETDFLIDKDCYIKVEQRGKNNAITEYIPLSDFQDIN